MRVITMKHLLLEFVVRPSAVEGIEDLSEGKGVEHDCRHNTVAFLCVI